MPHIDTAVFAEYFPTYAFLIVAALIGFSLGVLVMGYSVGKLMERKINTLTAVVLEAMEELTHPLHAAEPLASPEAYEAGTCQHQRRVQVGSRLICDDCGGIGFVRMSGAPEAGTLTREERAEEYRSGTENPRFTDFSGPYTWTSDEPIGRL